MSDSESGETGCRPDGGYREKSAVIQAQLAYVAEVFGELFKLMEEYAPAWYTEEHYKRAASALRVLEESREFAKSVPSGLEGQVPDARADNPAARASS